MTYRDHMPEGFRGRAFIRGDLLPYRLRLEAISAYVHRFTRNHVPLWSRKPMPNGETYRVQFASDAEWLANSLFPVTVRKDGSLGDHTRGACQSFPTWPDGVPPNAGWRPTEIPAFTIR